MDNIRFIFYTTQRNLSLVKLSVEWFLRQNVNEKFKISILTNFIPLHAELIENNCVSYMNAEIDFDCAGRQFSSVLSKLLPQIEEEYIFFFCDDYFILNPIDEKEFKKLLLLIKIENVDLFGFEDYVWHEPVSFFLQTHGYFPTTYFLHKPLDLKHIYSVQPCIWKKESLLKLAQNYNFSLHDLDTTREDLIQPSFKCIVKTRQMISDAVQKYPNKHPYFILNYLEIVRCGVFMHEANGYDRKYRYDTNYFVERLILENNLFTNSNFTNLLYQITPDSFSTIT